MQREYDPERESFRYAEKIQNYFMLRKDQAYFFDLALDQCNNIPP